MSIASTTGLFCLAPSMQGVCVGPPPWMPTTTVPSPASCPVSIHLPRVWLLLHRQPRADCNNGLVVIVLCSSPREPANPSAFRLAWSATAPLCHCHSHCRVGACLAIPKSGHLFAAVELFPVPLPASHVPPASGPMAGGLQRTELP